MTAFLRLLYQSVPYVDTLLYYKQKWIARTKK